METRLGRNGSVPNPMDSTTTHTMGTLREMVREETVKPSKIEKLKTQRAIYENKATDAMNKLDFDEAAKWLGLVSLYNHKIQTEIINQWRVGK